MNESESGDRSFERKLPPSERIKWLERIISAVLIKTSSESTEGQKEIAQESLDQCAHILYNKSWEEVKKEISKEK